MTSRAFWSTGMAAGGGSPAWRPFSKSAGEAPRAKSNAGRRGVGLPGPKEEREAVRSKTRSFASATWLSCSAAETASDRTAGRRLEADGEEGEAPPAGWPEMEWREQAVRSGGGDEPDAARHSARCIFPTKFHAFRSRFSGPSEGRKERECSRGGRGGGFPPPTLPAEKLVWRRTSSRGLPSRSVQTSTQDESPGKGTSWSVDRGPGGEGGVGGGRRRGRAESRV